MNANLTTPDSKQAYTAESLPDYPLFDGLSERHRQILAECSMRASFNAGEVVVEAGEPAKCFYLVVSGSGRATSWAGPGFAPRITGI